MRSWLTVACCCITLFAGAQNQDAWLLQKAPAVFSARFVTTKGSFTIEAIRNWSPLAVDRLYQLIRSGFYNNTLFFRVEKGFVAQFGISGTQQRNHFWDAHKLPDEPALHKNTKGAISFARAGKNDRCTQLFINLADNRKLDTDTRLGATGYTPVARIVEGIEIAGKLNGQYGKQPALIQDSLYKYGNFYFEERFPALDRIISATILR